jgi:UDP:flavonoid glycosyltransferase YjiC (YdhE family)
MRVLFSATPAIGHLLPLFPLARAFGKRGHQVGFATSLGMAPLVEPEGFTLLPAGPMPDALFAEVARRSGVDPATNPTSEGMADFFAGVRLDLGGDRAIAAARDFGPSLVVSEMWDSIGPLVATALKIPLATVALSPARSQEFFDAMAALAAPRYAHRGLVAPASVPSGRWLLDTCPPSLQFPGVRRPGEHIALRPQPHQAAAPLPDPRPGIGSGAAAGVAGRRPRVLVTFGTYYAEPAVLGPLLKSLARLDVELAATLGPDGKAEDYDLDPQRVELVPFVPIAQLLDRVSAVVTHGGSGTTLGTLARGIPMVVIPQGADQSNQADRVAASGAGLALAPDEYTPAAAGKALSRVLNEPRFTETARHISDEIAAMPSPEDVAERLEAAIAA